MRKFILLGLYLFFVAAIFNVSSFDAIAGGPSTGQYILASCGTKGVHLYIIADTEKELSHKIQDGKIFLTWADPSLTGTNFVVFYDKLKLEVVKRGHLHLTGSVVLPPPMGSTLPIDLTITKEMDSGGRVGPDRVTCATTSFFDAYQ